jgi:hypothetical protein
LRGLNVQFWGRDAELMAQIRDSRRNERYLPDLVLPDNITGHVRSRGLATCRHAGVRRALEGRAWHGGTRRPKQRGL